MTFFRWIRYSFVFEYNVDMFTLLLVDREFKIKILNSLI